MKTGNSLKKNYIDIVLVQTALLSEANSTSYSRLSVLKTIPELKTTPPFGPFNKIIVFCGFMSMVT
jgi:hypothetical protein